MAPIRRACAAVLAGSARLALGAAGAVLANARVACFAHGAEILAREGRRPTRHDHVRIVVAFRFDGNFVCPSADSEVSPFTPRRAPTVLDQPVLDAVVDAPADCDDGVTETTSVRFASEGALYVHAVAGEVV